MTNDYGEGLKGSVDQAIASQKRIAKYFTGYGSSCLPDASKRELIYATKVMHSIAECELKHPKIYCDIVVRIFGDRLKPEAGAKYWDSYVDCLRYFHYSLADKKEYEMCSLLYNHVLLYNNKLENESVCFKLVNIYSYHLFLQNSLLSSNREAALRDAHNVLDNLTYLFQEMLQKNKQLNFLYKDILKKTVQCLFPRIGHQKISNFFNTLRSDKVSTMLESIFKLSTQQRMPSPLREESQQHALYIMETLHTLVQFDICNKFRLQLSVQLLNHCRVDSQITSHKPMAELCTLLYEYVKLIFLQSRVADFPKHFTKRCERFKELFDQHSKILIAQSWFRDFLVILNYLHSQMENTTVFACFWEQMSTPLCFKSLLGLIMETMKLSPCITADTTLNWITCCSSFRKHVILLFAQIALTTFVIYCQKVPSEQEDKEDETTTDAYNGGLHKILILIVNHAFRVIEKMDCISSTSYDINYLITRFKQAAISAKTKKQAGTCMALCELFLKIKLKMPEHEWPLILRRLYRVVEQCMENKCQLKRELQMCYITSMLQLSSELDFNQVRAQITMYYSQNSVDNQENTTPALLHDKCLLHMFQNSKNVLRPQLNPARKKLLHWLEMQHIVKYYKSNAKLMQSLMQCSQTQYDFVMIARLEKVQTSQVLAKLVAIQKSLKSKAEESTGLSRLEQLTYAHTCIAILQDQKNVFIQNPSKFESKDFGEGQLGHLLTRSEMETMTIRKELCYVKLAYVAFKAFDKFYKMFDDEDISSDDALIDWEAIIDDLVTLAQFLQLGGYIEYCSHAWVLLYKISMLVQDNFSAFRAFAFICEYSEFFGKTTDSPLELDREIQLQLPILTQALAILPSLSTRKQTYVLLVTIQVAYYYARCSKYTFAQILWQFVDQKHQELPELQGRYDVVMCTLDIARYRVLWKHGKSGARKMPSAGECALLNQNLMRDIELTLERFRNFVFLTSSDSLMYIILICNLLQDIAECSANRLYDKFMSNVFAAVCKCALSHGLALRMVQIMSSWMWINLQMEFVDEAHTKLKIIEYIMGVATLKDLSENKVATATTDVKSSTLVPSQPFDMLGLNTGIEAIRKLAQVQLSPIKTGKLQLRGLARKHDLKSYLTYKIEMTSMPSSELFEWIYFIIACFNARLNFLVEDFDQLEAFYEQGSEWLQKRQNDFHKRYFKNFQLVAIQHYANFLRACRKNEEAKQCLTYALNLCECMKLDIDVVYRVNFKLQLLSACTVPKKFMNKNVTGKYNKILTYNVSPEDNKEKHDKAKQAIKNQLIQEAMCSSRKPPVTVATTSSNNATTTTRRNKVKSIKSGSSSPETKSKTKTKLKFNICSDSMEGIDLNANIDSVLCMNTSTHEVKSTTPTNDIEKTVPRSSRDKKSTKTPSNVKTDYSHSMVTIDLTDTPPATSSSSSSMECLKIKENQPENEIVKQLENFKSYETKKKPPNVSRLRKPAKARKPSISAPVIVLGDSPGTMSSKANPQRSGMRRQRKIISENNETQESNHPTSSIISSAATVITSSLSTRRRQKI